MKIKRFKLKDLQPAGYNPRTISDEALAGLAKSIERFGCVEPIVVNIRGGKNTIVGGHQRYKALEQAGAKDCQCVTVDLKRADEKLLNLALNNPEIQGEFIAELDVYIAELRGNISEDDYLGLRIDELRSELDEPKEGLCGDDEVPDVPAKPKTRRGDLWQLGRHRLVCGDSTDEADVKKLMGKKKADMVFTDPPYGIDYLPETEKLKSLGKLASDKPYPNGYREFSEWLEAIVVVLHDTVMRQGACYYIWMSWQYIGALEAAWRKRKAHPKDLIVWDRVMPRMTKYPQDYLPVAEFCLYGWKRGKKKINNNPEDAMRTSVWHVKRLNAVDMEHTTQKPTALAENAINMSSNRGDVVIDLFLGSGSTLIACEKLDRRCFGMEIDPKYCDVVVKRWEEWTGKKAKRVRD